MPSQARGGESDPRVTAAVIEATVRAQHGRVVAVLTRILGDVGLAEDALSEAVVTALSTWPERGRPDDPAAWIVTTARNHGLDRLRREAKRTDKEAAAALEAWRAAAVAAPPESHPVPDDQLRLLFTCAHPALSAEARVALTLRLACGLTTREIARALLAPEATVAQRLSRAKRRIRTTGIAFRVPAPEELPSRLVSVLACIELIYREGYAATGGEELIRGELCVEGLRLARLLASLLPDEPEVLGLAALLCLLDARRASRTAPDGELVLLEDQDRTRFDRALIAEGSTLLERASARRARGPYQVRAAIAAEHATAPAWEATDWAAIATLYERLAELAPSPVVELNRAVAVALRDTPAAGLAHLETEVDEGRLARSHLLEATRADLLRRLGRREQAATAYAAAIELAPTGAERRYLERRLACLGEVTPAP